MEISGIIIAGGKSERMRTDKTSIIFQKKTFLQNSVELLENFTRQIFISCNQNLSHPDYPVLKDEIKDLGPIGGIYSVLKQIKTQQALVIPVDMPLLNKNVLEYLLKHAQNDKLVNVFKDNKNTQMLVGIYDKKILPVLEKQIQNRKYKLQDLLQKTSANLIDGSKFRHLFININTPKDLKKIKQEYGD